MTSFTAALINTRVVFWNEAAERKLLRDNEVSVIPKINLSALATSLPSAFNLLLASTKIHSSTTSPTVNGLSPELVILLVTSSA